MNRETVEKATQYVTQHLKHSPKIGMILGARLGEFTHYLSETQPIPYQQIPGFPRSTVGGHAGNFVFGEMARKSIVAMQGRFHLYEGHTIDKVILPILVMHELGVQTLI